jgi:hypothetical protein
LVAWREAAPPLAAPILVAQLARVWPAWTLPGPVAPPLGPSIRHMAPFMEEEIKNALLQREKNKVACLDSIPMEFCPIFGVICLIQLFP